jgi:MFS family permease
MGLPRVFWCLFAGVLINRLGGFVFTFLAIYLTQERQVSVTDAGAFIGLYGAGSFASGPAGGFVADRFGRRRVLLAAFVMSALAMVQMGFARSMIHMAISTLVLGFFSDLYRPALQAAVADVVRPEQRTRAYGYLYWAVNLGTAGAAILGAFLATANFQLLFFADAATSLAFALVVVIAVPETRRCVGVSHDERISVLAPYRDRVFMLFVGAQLLVAIVFAQAIAALPVDMRANGITTREYGFLLSINGFMICAMQPLLIHRLQRYARWRVLAVGGLLTGAGMGVIAVAHGPLSYAVSIVLWTFGELAFSPVAPTVVADLAPRSLRASYQGTFQMSWGFAWLFAASVGALVLDNLGRKTLWGACCFLGLVAAAMHMAIAPARRRHLATLDESQGAVEREDGIARAA